MPRSVLPARAARNRVPCRFEATATCCHASVMENGHIGLIRFAAQRHPARLGRLVRREHLLKRNFSN